MKTSLAALAATIFTSTLAFAALPEIVTDHPVGFAIVSVPDPQGPAFDMGVWYPTTAAPAPKRLGLASVRVAMGAPVDGSSHPLVIISHGNQGAVASHADTAMALADAGFIVAAPVHTGDNFGDQSAVGGPKWFVDRARHIKVAVDFLLTGWPSRDRIDANRIGIFGFSAGGTTALIAIGGVPDLDGLSARCKTVAEFACTLWKGGPAGALTQDPRIKAAVIAAPGFGFAFLPDGLKGVTVPVQLWNGGADTNVPAATNAAPLRNPLKAEYHLVPGAQHFSFLVPCAVEAEICQDAPGFDRTAFHKVMNAKVVRFFQKALK